MRLRHHVFLPMALCVLSTGTWAQTVYKCGHSYSQIPCPDAVEINTQDTRTAAQQKAAEHAATKQAQQAKALETQRLQEEAAAEKAARAQTKRENKKTAPAPKSHKASATKPKGPAYFTARAPGDAAKKKKPESQPPAP